MFLTRSRSALRGLPSLSAALLLVAGLSGCYTQGGGKTRESRFINMDSEIVEVTYSTEKRTETLPNGIVCTFDGKVRLRLPSGKAVTLYQTMTASGVRYVSKNKQYEFVEKGPCCRLFFKGTAIFEGVYCRNN